MIRNSSGASGPPPWFYCRYKVFFCCLSYDLSFLPRAWDTLQNLRRSARRDLRDLAIFYMVLGGIFKTRCKTLEEAQERIYVTWLLFLSLDTHAGHACLSLVMDLFFTPTFISPFCFNSSFTCGCYETSLTCNLTFLCKGGHGPCQHKQGTK